MVRRKTEGEVSITDKSHEDNLPAETGAAEIDVSKSVIVDAAEYVLFQSEYEVQTVEEAEKENDATLVGCGKVDKNTIDAAEDEHIHEEHAAEEVEMELGEAKEGEEGLDDYDDDNADDFDVNDDDNDVDDDFDEGEEGLDDYDDDSGDDVDDDDENDYLMEEEEFDKITKLENNDNTVKESDESQRKRVAQGKKEENAKEENEEREGRSLKKEEKTVKKGEERKKVTEEVSDKVASKRKDMQEEGGQGDAMEEADQENAKEDIQDKEGSSKQKVKKLRKRKRRKVAAGGFEKVASKRDDKVESLRRKKVKSMGMIFMCSSKTKKDCYHYKVLGLPANKRDVVGKIYKGMRLFLYDVDLKLLYGIYKAAGPGGYNIQPRAFNSLFPSQVRFTVLEDCLPLAEEKFKKVIKDNYFTKTKFDCQLTSQQVKNLCKLFVSASKGSKAIRSARRVKTRASTDQDRSRARGEERRSARSEKRGYHEHSRNREREVVASPVPPVSQRLLPPAAAAPSHPYDRTLELDASRRDWFVVHRDSHRHPVPEPRLEQPIVYRRDPLLHQLDSYRRDVAVEHHDLRLRDEIGRLDPYISYRERPEHRDLRSRDDFGRQDLYFSYRGSTEDHNLHLRDDFRRRDPHISLRELPAYRDHIYGTDPLPEHEHYRPINRSEYLSALAPLPEYRSAHSLYRYLKY